MKGKKFLFVFAVSLLAGYLTYLYQDQETVSSSEALVSARAAYAESPPDTQGEASVVAKVPDAKVEMVKEILLKKHDNDPRIDSDLKDLSPESRRALHQFYHELPAEDRNGRGLVVLLISRDPQLPEDYEFLQSIYQENPCLSLADCNQVQTQDPHLSGVNSTSLVYPQMVALYQIEKKLRGKSSMNPVQAQQIQQVVRQAENFAVPSVQDKANEIQSRF